MLSVSLSPCCLKRKSGNSVPVAFPDFGANLLYKDYLGYGRVFEDVAGQFPIDALGDPVGLVWDYSGLENHSLQNTSSRKPLLRLDSGGRFYLNHDRIDDYLSLSNLIAGTYTCGFSSWDTVQIFEIYHKTTGEFKWNPADTHSRVLVQGSLTNQQKIDLRIWLESRRIASGNTDVFRIHCGSSSVNLSVVESSNSGSSWLLGDNQTASGTSCVKTITVPQTLIYRATDPTKITQINWSSKNLFGLVDLSKLVNVTIVYLSTNTFSGCLDLTSNTLLQTLYVSNNFFGGTLNLSLNTQLQTLQVGNNQFTGNINITTNTSLITAGFTGNCFSGFSGSVSNTVDSFQAQNNLLTQAAVDAILLAFVNANRTTGSRILNLGGTGNAAPSATGLGYKSTLTSRGWTVTHN
jgi:hypothetical protein